MGWIWVDGTRVRGSAVVTDRVGLAAAVRRPGGPGVNEVARRVGVSPSAISMLLSGRRPGRPGCELETAKRVAAALGLVFDDFFSVRTFRPTEREGPSEDTPARRTA